ncbi:MAG TPA: alkaline phosphatase [Phaeodactylibacter sp.]|nr:alkaline phosphatase [Phaeodactylibacter sp.]
MKRIFIYFSLLLLLSLGCSTSPPLQGTAAVGGKARNVILMIGDGMGLAQITAASLSTQGPLAMESFPFAGLHKPHAEDNLITDSAAGATAFATGVKTNKGTLGLDSKGAPVRNIVEEAEARGYATGLVTTASVVHATPAAFVAHLPLHNQYEQVAAQFLEQEIDLFIGGGRRYFLESESGQPNVLQEMMTQGYNISSYLEGPLADLPLDFNRRLGYFTAEDQPPKAQEGRDYLPVASRFAPRFLQKHSQEGFFLMIEGAQIEWAGHENDQAYLIEETLDFDQAVREALKFARRDKETLVIVTSDHETGGYSIQPGSTRDSLIAGFSTDEQTGSLVPVMAYGPGAELFRGLYDNTAIYYKMKQALGWY